MKTLTRRQWLQGVAAAPALALPMARARLREQSAINNDVAYGQTTNQQSPHSSDQMQLFAGHELRRAWYSEADIRANLLREYRP